MGDGEMPAVYRHEWPGETGDAKTGMGGSQYSLGERSQAAQM